MLKIIHLSDFHLEQFPLSFDKENLVKEWIEDLKKYIDNETILVFTGDALDKGGQGFKDKTNPFTLFEQTLLTPLLEKKLIQKNNIFFVPGNHDIQRDKINDFEDIGIKETLKKSYEDFNKKLEDNKVSFDRMQDFLNFESDFYSDDSTINKKKLHRTFSRTVNNLKIGIACINSSFICKDDSDYKNIAVGRKQIESSIQELPDCDIKVCLMHHPIEFLDDKDKEHIKPIIYNNFDILLTGHTHFLQGAYQCDLDGSLFYSVGKIFSGENTDSVKYQTGYSIIEYHLNQEIKITSRKFSNNAIKFIANTDIGDDKGEKIIQINGSQEVAKKRKLRDDIYNKLKESHCESINNDLIIYNVGLKNEFDINKIFVAPTISNYPENNSTEDEHIKWYSLDDIINSNQSFVIFGQKESGKTILLDKLLLDFVRARKCIPILINFYEADRKDPKSLIKQFLAIKNEDLETILNDESIILLIDNFNFDAHAIVDKYINITNVYPNIRIIATHEQELPTAIPIVYFESPHAAKFIPLFIHSLNFKQIKKFVLNWFGDKQMTFNENMEKLLKNFIDLGLPRTPLSITLFLWVIEKQEKKPINHSALIEIFINNLLESANFENIYSETYDSGNKRRLLAKTAKHMLDNGDSKNNYCISYSVALNFFQGYLKGRVQISAKAILDNFIKRGIFCLSDSELLTFKNGFFFHYFLAKYIDIDADFKKYILTDNNYENFVDEIDIYSGLKKDDQHILKFVIQKLDEAFGQFNEKLLNEPSSIDSFFETKKTITSNLNFEAIKKKPTEEEIEKILDSQLSNVPVKNNVEEKKIIQPGDNARIGAILKLASKVLKNSEDVDDSELRNAAYKKVITSSISFLLLYRMYLVKHINDKGNISHLNLPKSLNVDFYIRLLPLIHQAMMMNWMGTPKLLPLIEDKIKSDSRSDSETSTLERFVDLFIYTDLKGRRSLDKIRDFLQNVEKRYILDLLILKLIAYYHLRANNPEQDHQYLSLISKTYSRINSNKNKSKFLENVKKNKSKKTNK